MQKSAGEWVECWGTALLRPTFFLPPGEVCDDFTRRALCAALLAEGRGALCVFTFRAMLSPRRRAKVVRRFLVFSPFCLNFAMEINFKKRDDEEETFAGLVAGAPAVDGRGADGAVSYGRFDGLSLPHPGHCHGARRTARGAERPPALRGRHWLRTRGHPHAHEPRRR